MVEKENSLPEAESSHYGLTEETARAIHDALDLDQHDLVKAQLSELHYADLADFISSASYEDKQKVIEELGGEFDPLVLIELDPSVKADVIEILGPNKTAEYITKLDLGDAVYVIEDLDEETQQNILNLLPQEIKVAVAESFTYPENSAGRIMEKLVVAAPEYWSVGQTIDYLRQQPDLPEDFYEIFVIDPKHHPVGGVLLSRLLRTPQGVHISEVMKKDIKVINTHTDQEEVSFLFRQYALVSAPVVNKDGRLVGVISMDDVMEVIEEEAEEDLLRMGGINETDLHAASFETARHRFPWLFVNLLTAFLTSTVINLFQDTIQQLVTLAALMPVVASMGGNAGTQTVTVAIRAIATKDLNSMNAMRVLFKESIACALNGLALAILGGITVLILYSDLRLSLIFASAVIINLTFAGFFGTLIPIMINRRGADPALSSSVFLTAITDMIAFFVFLGIAKLLLT
jgi:magnesium transporter